MTIIDYMRQNGVSENIGVPDRQRYPYGFHGARPQLWPVQQWGQSGQGGHAGEPDAAPQLCYVCSGPILHGLLPAGQQQFPSGTGYWLEQLPEEDGLSANIGNQEMEARFIKAITSNAMAMQPMGETVNDGILYQIQIQVTYQIESEE